MPTRSSSTGLAGVIRRARGLVLVCAVAAAGCDNEVVVLEHGGTTGAGGTTGSSVGSGGSGGAPPRTIDVSLSVVPATADAHQVLVLLNHADGTLVSSRWGDALPTKVEVADGDVVSFAYEKGSVADSFRVGPATTAIDHQAILGGPQTPCELHAYHVVVHVPLVPGGGEVVASGDAGYAQTFGTPATLEFDGETCDAKQVVTVRVENTTPSTEWVAVQRFEGVPTSDVVSLDATFPPPPRVPMTVSIPSLGKLHHVEGSMGYIGTIADIPATEPWVLNYTNEPGPHEFSGSPLAFPSTTPFLSVDALLYTGTPGICPSQLHLYRTGAPEGPLSFDAPLLAEPGFDGKAWTLGPGIVGTSLTVNARVGADPKTRWTLQEDPTFGPLPSIVPAFPDELPQGWDQPAGELDVSSVAHRLDTFDSGTTSQSRVAAFHGCP